MEHPSHPVESHWRTSLRNRIIQASSLLEVLLSGLVLIGLLLSVVPLIRWMPGLLFDGNEAEIRTFLERSLDIVIGIEFIKMLAKHSPGSSLEVLLYAIARHLVVGHDSAVENLLSVGAIALIFIVRKFFFVSSFGAHLPDDHPAPDLTPAQSGILICNPPYGQRMLEQQSAQRLYAALGRHLRYADGWKKYIITSEPEFEHYFGRRADKKRKLYNGMIKCDYYMYLGDGRK